MPTLYADTKQRYWILAPQTTKWRHRYRGQRESWKINLEMNQFLYDVRKLYEGTITVSQNLANNLYNLEFGLTISPTYSITYDDDSLYDSSAIDYGIDGIELTGEQDYILRVTRLLKRVEKLESGI